MDNGQLDDGIAQFDLSTLDEQGVAQLFTQLGFPFYDSQLAEHGITGDVLVHLDHSSLKDIGVHSVGHRLAILRAVHTLKLQQNIPIESGHYVPPSEDVELPNPNPPPQGLFNLLTERDDRIRNLEHEVQKLHETMSSLRGDSLRPASKPPSRIGLRSPTSSLFPHPLSNQSTLSRANSTSRVRDGSMGSQAAPAAAAGLPDSPRSPMESPRMGMTENGSELMSMHQHGVTGVNGSTSAGLTPGHEYSAPLTSGGALTPTTPTAPYLPDPTHAREQASSAPNTASGVSQTLNPRPSTSAAVTDGSTSASVASGSTSSKKEGSTGGASSSTNSKHADNPYRSFRVTLEDPCHKVLPAALKKYKINDDWRQYALFICYGNTERCLAYDEKPLLLFQKLKESNNNPVFMLRHIKDIKSPIAVASAKHAARREKRAAGIGGGVDKTPSVNRDGVEAVKMTAQRPTRLHHPPVLLPVGKDKDKQLDGDVPPPSPREAFGYCISIYPYLAEREDEFDVAVGDTFVIISKTKGWWVVHRDLGTSVPDTAPRKSAWVPAGCLLETSVPPLSLSNNPALAAAGGNASGVPIEPQYVVSVSTPNIVLMDYEKHGSDELDVRKGTAVRILKRYNHWSYAIKEDGQRGWIPSWFCGRAPKPGDAGTPTTPTAPVSSSAHGNGTAAGPPVLPHIKAGASEPQDSKTGAAVPFEMSTS